MTIASFFFSVHTLHYSAWTRLRPVFLGLGWHLWQLKPGYLGSTLNSTNSKQVILTVCWRTSPVKWGAQLILQIINPQLVFSLLLNFFNFHNKNFSFNFKINYSELESQKICSLLKTTRWILPIWRAYHSMATLHREPASSQTLSGHLLESMH